METRLFHVDRQTWRSQQSCWRLFCEGFKNGWFIYTLRNKITTGIATRYWLDGPGIESLTIPVAERSKARVCGRSLAGIAGLNPAWAWMFVFYVVSKCKVQGSQDKETSTDEVQTECKRIQSISGWGEILRTRPHWPTQPPIQLVPSLFPRGKAAGAWRWPPTSIERWG